MLVNNIQPLVLPPDGVPDALATIPQADSFTAQADAIGGGISPSVDSQEKSIRRLEVKNKASQVTKGAFQAARGQLLSFFGGLISGIISKFSPTVALFKLTLSLLQLKANAPINALKAGERLKGLALQKHAKSQRMIDKALALLGLTPPAPPVFAADPKIVVKENLVADLITSPSSNDPALEAASASYKDKKHLEDAASTPSFHQLETASDINQKLSEMGIPELREWVKELPHRNYQIDKFLLGFPLFNPMSEYTAAWFKAYSPDKASVQLNQWGAVSLVRKNLVPKLTPGTHATIEKAYSDLNKSFYICLPNEFAAAIRANNGGVAVLPTAHSFHIVGDFLYPPHMNPLSAVGQLIDKGIMTALGDTQFLIDYIYPVQNDITVENTMVTVFEEDHKVLIDKKKDIFRAPLDGANNTVLTPEKII